MGEESFHTLSGNKRKNTKPIWRRDFGMWKGDSEKCPCPILSRTNVDKSTFIRTKSCLESSEDAALNYSYTWDIPALECALRCASQSPPRLLWGEAPRKRGPGGSKDALETIGHIDTSLRIWVLETDSASPAQAEAAETAKDRGKWKSIRPSKRC